VIIGKRTALNLETSRAHNVPFVLLGTALLNFGWCGLASLLAYTFFFLVFCIGFETYYSFCQSLCFERLQAWLQWRKCLDSPERSCCSRLRMTLHLSFLI
jgi:ammonia channel protein AmtB